MSFKDSKIAAAANSAMTLSAELAVDTEEYTLCTDGRYEVYTKYQDNAYSTVDNLKNIAVDATQINIMQEENSQYMPFRIPRYWDGMDLMDMLIQIRYESVAEKKGKVATVINVASNNTYIRFGWLIDAAVTANAGDIIFEIMATGVNEKGNNYIWRTRPNGQFTVLQGLNYDGIIEPSEDWYTSFVNMILGHVAEAKQYADEAKASAASINVDDIKADVTASVTANLNQTVAASLKDYYTKTEIDQTVEELNTAISGIDSLKNLKIEYDNTSGHLVFKDKEEQIGEITINSLSNLVVEYSVVNGKGSLVFKNGETEIQTVELSSIEPSVAWTSALKEDISKSTDEKLSPVVDRVSALETAKDDLAGKVETNTTDISGLKTDVAGLKESNETISATTTETKNTVDILKQNVSGYDSQFESINSDITAINKSIKDLGKNTGHEYDVSYEENVFTLYTFKGWDGSLTGIFADRTIKAVYNSKVREYTVKYVSKGLTLQESTGQYGSYIKYEGDTPTYTAEESAYKYNLFKGWDKSGFVDGNKTINAVYETCEYVDGYFDGKDLANMTQVELYTLMKMGLEAKSLSLKDTLDFKLGVDYSYGDIEEHEVISAATKFDGTNYIDTGLKIMEKDRDFTIAIDFEFDTDNSVNSTLAQCFQGDGSNGFRLWYSQEPRFSWNTDSITPSAGTNREIIVFRHEAGSQKLYVYNSNMTGKEVSSTTLNAIRIPEHSSTLVFGCSKADDGAYENFAKGTVHWAKVWYADLGEEQCMDIAAWIHEIIPMEVAKFKGYYLSDVASKRANITFVASNLLGTEKPYNNKSTNAGGWAESSLNTWLNTRLLKAISPLWKALIKPVKVYSSIGNKSNDTSVSNCRFYVPSLYEIDPTATSEPYISETNAPIAYFTDDDTRKKANSSTPTEYKSYWTRSPNATVANWLYTVNEAGGTYGFSYPGQNSGILLMFSISSEG